LTHLEEDVSQALHIIAPDVQRLNLLGREQRGRRIPMAKVDGWDDPVPLRSMGEGLTRLFSITLALVNAKDGLLLIDEVESGLHYSVHTDLWRLIFQLADRLNVQVFATTHSWDCIEGLQKSAQEEEHRDGMLIRLENRKGEIIPILFDEHRLGIATREDIEVR
jgi:AAA15 family ATPase/GTPase